MRPRRLLALLAAAMLVVATPVPAHADPDPDGAPPGGTIQDQLTTATKGYADAKAKLDAAVAKQEKFRADLALSTTRLAELTSQIGVLAAAAYRAGPGGTAALLLDSGSPDDLAERAGSLRQLGLSEDRQLREFNSVLATAGQQQAALDQEINAAKIQTDETARRKADIQKTLDQLGRGPTAGVPIPAATAAPAPRNPDGSFPNEGCSVKDPTTTGGLTPRTLHALQEARKAGFTHFTACLLGGTWGEHPLGRACDFAAAPGGFGGVARGSDRDYGNRLAGWCIANAGRLGVVFVILVHPGLTAAVRWGHYPRAGTPSGDPLDQVPP